ncbi:oxidoreductase [Streptomyces sp. NPDC051940]|uniref:oxidoreductase n=1 Tax=Streptomyces sp. NPDC051940 TaxID=3155675 RepID=UPI003429B486
MTHTSAGDPPDDIDLTPAELGMWQAFRNGSMYDLRDRDPARNDPAGPHAWGAERSVRARVVALLLLDGPPPLRGRVACLKLNGVHVTGTLDLSGGQVKPYVELRNCRFQHEVLLPECHVTTLRMVGCAIPRLEAARIHTEGDLHLPRCTVDGGIRLTDARIGTDLLLSQLTVRRDRHGRAIAADGLAVGQDLQAELIQVYGEVSLRGASVGASLTLNGGVLRNPYGKRALNAPQLTVERSLHMTSAWRPGAAAGRTTPPYGTLTGLSGLSSLSGLTGPPAGPSDPVQAFECHGGLRLDDGRIGDSIDFGDARFVMDPDQELSLRRLSAPELRFTGRRPERGRVVLSGARVGNLVDRSTSWPGPGELVMAGFTYEHLIAVGPFPLSHRLAWVEAATPEYSPEPYEKLAAVLRHGGEDDAARLVLLAKHRRHRETLRLAGKVWGYVQDCTVAYGYRPSRAVLWMAVLWALGSVYFGQHRPDAIRPGEGPSWNPVLYALDLLLPVIDLGQAGAWEQTGAYQWAAAGLVLAGWVLATTVAAGASRLLRKQ